VAGPLLVCHFQSFFDFRHGLADQLLWLFDFEFSVAGLEIDKGVVIGELVTHLKIVSKVFLDLKEFYIASILGQP
jgi:hypothetical protein